MKENLKKRKLTEEAKNTERKKGKNVERTQSGYGKMIQKMRKMKWEENIGRGRKEIRRHKKKKSCAPGGRLVMFTHFYISTVILS